MRAVIRCEPDQHGRDARERYGLVPARGYRASDDRFGAGSNALIMLNRVGIYEVGKPGQSDAGKRALVRWACEQKLGQHAELVAAVQRRRDLALRIMRSDKGHRPCHFVRLLATPEWRLAAGLGNNANAHEVGLALHGTYGWPVIPGSSLKGLALAWARASSEVKPDDVERVFGTTKHAGSVRFLDAIPADQPVAVEADVLTPHVKPYYDSVANGSPHPLVPPAEYHNPVPVTFLTVRGTYAVDLYGPDQQDLKLAAEWLRQAGEELGAGAKTAAGYGYLAMTPTQSGAETA
jgi:CRISPR-associated protein Cmr6